MYARAGVGGVGDRLLSRAFPGEERETTKVSKWG
jgi:hypothetical protein